MDRSGGNRRSLKGDDSILPFDFEPVVAPFSNGTYSAKGLFCHAGFSTMPDEEIRKMGPLFLRNDLH
jgi:hypothetical protein